MRAFTAIFIHLIVPISGVLFYLRIVKKLGEDERIDNLKIPLFFIFLHFGGWLLVILTVIFWEVSGMFAIGFIYLLTFAPIIMFGLSVWLFPNREKTKMHKICFWLSSVYTVLAVSFFSVIIIANTLKY